MVDGPEPLVEKPEHMAGFSTSVARKVPYRGLAGHAWAGAVAVRPAIYAGRMALGARSLVLAAAALLAGCSGAGTSAGPIASTAAVSSSSGTASAQSAVRRKPRPGHQPGGGVPGRGVPGRGVPGRGVPGRGVPGRGVPGRGVPGRGQPGRGQPGRGQPGPPPSLVVSSASRGVIQPQPAPGSCHMRGTGLFSLPDPHCTPGAIDPTVTPADIQSTICADGWTETVRPPESITEPEKEASLAAYGDAGPLHNYEYDHLVPLELGGAGNDPRNLWPEPGATPNPKDDLENRMRSMVCAGEISLAAAQREIAADWVTAYHRLVG